uniref:Uncharacterized protein n=1 Tax=Romanomermis culicivorax TaxID=13658 RepID=A0A915HR98_ROMCU
MKLFAQTGKIFVHTVFIGTKKQHKVLVTRSRVDGIIVDIFAQIFGRTLSQEAGTERNTYATELKKYNISKKLQLETSKKNAKIDFNNEGLQV